MVNLCAICYNGSKPIFRRKGAIRLGIWEYIKAALLGIVQGITEWLPISSTGHMILLDEFIQMKVTEQFKELFLVVVQLGSILAVVVLYWKQLWPLTRSHGQVKFRKKTMIMWGKILISCVPAAIVGVLLDDYLNKLFYNWTTVAIMLILFGVLFIVAERINRNKTPRCTSIDTLTCRDALLIGVFQLIAAVFPGTSRSGATIVGALMIGIGRTTAAEYTFYLAVPVMFGASLLKLLKFGMAFTGAELAILLIGMVTAFVVSILVIRFLMRYIKKHDFTVFGWYRIILGLLVILYFTLIR